MGRKSRRTSRPTTVPKSRETSFHLTVNFDDVRLHNRRIDYFVALYYELEEQRHKIYGELLNSIREGAAPTFEFSHWTRLVHYRYSLTAPLSMRGSLMDVGGRFNFGDDIGRKFAAFPALYIADGRDAAYREYYGISSGSGSSGLTTEEFELTHASSITMLSLNGFLQGVIDIGDNRAMSGFLSLIKKFKISSRVKELASRAKIPQPSVISTMGALKKQLLEPRWQRDSQLMGVPSNPQIFGKIAFDAGCEGVLFPSTKDSTKRCVAVFPDNFDPLRSFVELADSSEINPSSEDLILRLDAKTAARLCK